MRSRLQLHVVRVGLAAAVMLLLAIAGMRKVVDAPNFEEALRLWRLIPAWAAPGIALVVPAFEVLVGFGWVLGVHRRFMRRAAVVMLVGYTTAYVIESAIAQPPRCDCMALLLAYRDFQDGIAAILLRNGALAGLLFVGSDGTKRRTPAIDPRLPRDATHPPRAFTLLETLLVIVLIGILISLLTPALSNIRDAARSARALSDVRSHAIIVGAYGADYKDLFPCITDPRFTHTLVKGPGDEILLRYFDARHAWWFGLADGYYGGRLWDASFFAPRRSGRQRGHPYWYSVTCMAVPEFWNLATRRTLGQFAPMRQSDVTFPSKKGVYINGKEPFVGRDFFINFDRWSLPLETAFCDGSASAIKSNDFRMPILDGEGPVDWPYTASNNGFPVVHTVDGIRGRDIR